MIPFADVGGCVLGTCAFDSSLVFVWVLWFFRIILEFSFVFSGFSGLFLHVLGDFLIPYPSHSHRCMRMGRRMFQALPGTKCFRVVQSKGVSMVGGME